MFTGLTNSTSPVIDNTADIELGAKLEQTFLRLLSTDDHGDSIHA